MAFDGIVRKKLRAHILRDSGTKVRARIYGDEVS